VFAVLSVALLGAVPSIAGDGDGQRLLRWKFKPGQTLRCISTSESNQAFEIGSTSVQKVTLISETRWFVERVDRDGSARIELTYARIFYRSKGPLVDVTYDSSRRIAYTGQAVRFARDFNLVLGTKLTFTISATGEVRDVAISERDQKRFENARTSSAALLTPEAFKNSIPRLDLPKGVVRPGATWTSRNSIRGADLLSTYRYVGRVKEGAKALEKIECKTVTEASDANTRLQPYRLKGTTGRETILFDSTAGQLVKRTAKTKSETAWDYENHLVGLEAEATSTVEFLVAGPAS
jgi:hypothetical protein